MKKMPKNKILKYILGSVAFLVVVLGVIILTATPPAIKNPTRSHGPVTLFQPHILSVYKDTINTQIRRVIFNNNLSLSDLDKIIFSETLSPDQNPDLWLYNKEKIGAIPMSSMQDSYSNYVERPELIFTFGNKIVGKGTEKSDLVAIFPRVKDDTCNYYKKKNGEVKASTINLQPTAEKVADTDINTLPQEEGCITVNSINYYYGLLVER